MNIIPNFYVSGKLKNRRLRKKRKDFSFVLTRKKSCIGTRWICTSCISPSLEYILKMIECATVFVKGPYFIELLNGMRVLQVVMVWERKFRRSRNIFMAPAIYGWQVPRASKLYQLIKWVVYVHCLCWSELWCTTTPRCILCGLLHFLYISKIGEVKT